MCIFIFIVQQFDGTDNSGDAAVCSSPGSSAAWKLQWGTGPATHFSNKLALNTDSMGHLYFDCSHS